MSSTEWTTNNTFTIISFESRGKKANYLASRVQCSTDCLPVNKLYFRMPNKRENATTTIIKCSNRNARIYVRCTCIEIASFDRIEIFVVEFMRCHNYTVLVATLTTVIPNDPPMNEWKCHTYTNSRTSRRTHLQRERENKFLARATTTWDNNRSVSFYCTYSLFLIFTYEMRVVANASQRCARKWFKRISPIILRIKANEIIIL